MAVVLFAIFTGFLTTSTAYLLSHALMTSGGLRRNQFPYIQGWVSLTYTNQVYEL